jgi:hypothetical protein
MRSLPQHPVFLGAVRCRWSWGCAPLLLCSLACGGGSEDPASESLPNQPEAGADDEQSADPASPGGAVDDGSDADGCCVDGAGLDEADPEANGEETLDDAVASLVEFSDPDSDFASVDVFDAEREVFHFDAAQSAMVSDATGARESAWTTDGNQLGSGGRFGTFMIRFGTEQGERRAYFTEVGNGTICNLELERDEALSIFATSELPPAE